VTKTERSINRVGATRGVSNRASVTRKTMFAVENDDGVLTFASHLVTLFANHMKLVTGLPSGCSCGVFPQTERGRYGEEEES
jgi:hypothetical protein